MSDTVQDAGDDAASQPYPVEWEADVVLRDGSTTHVRPITPDDADALQEFHVAQSERSTYMRFFTSLRRLPERDLRRFTTVDHHDRVALIAVSTSRDDQGASERIIGVARFDRIDTDEAEVAFNVADSQQGKGLGSVLLEHIAAVARERGVRRFTAEVLAQNGRMLAVFREAGYAVRQHVEDGVVTVTVDLDPTERSRSVMAERERRDEARSVLGLFEPASVVVVVEEGDGTQCAQLAARVVTNLVSSTTPGAPEGLQVTVVGLDSPDLSWPTDRVTFHAELADVPGTVELAVLAVPDERTPTLVRSLARLDPHGVVIVSEGSPDPDQTAPQRRLLRVAHTAGMRVVGPGSYGLLRTADGVSTDATLATSAPPVGGVGIFCQSAPTAVTLLGTVRRRGLGLSTFVSAGSRADLSGNDLMQFWHEDAATRVVCLFLESIGNPRKFSRIARRLSMMKPIVAVTASAGSDAGADVTRNPRRTMDEMLRQCGVVRADNTHQMIDIAQLLETQPLPAGARVGVVASSQALAGAVAEAASAVGLEVVGPPGVVAENASDEATRAVVDAVFDDPGADAVVAVNIPLLDVVPEAFLSAVADAAARTGRTTVASVLGRHGLVDALRSSAPDGSPVAVPAYATPEDALLALARVTGYAAWRAADHGTAVAPEGIDVARARELVEDWCSDDDVDQELGREQARDLLACYGIDVVPARLVTSLDDAIATADELGWPVVLKSTAGQLRHRADLGGVRLDITDEAQLRSDYDAMDARMRAQFGASLPLEIQPMVDEGVSCVVACGEDPLFGPVVSFGLAGDAIDLLEDVSYGMPPLTDVDVAGMIRSVRAAPRLFGYRGLPPMRTSALEDVLARVSRMADDLPELRSLVLHPVVVATAGARVLGAQAVLRRSRRHDDTRRSLTR